MSVEQSDGIRGHWAFKDGKIVPLKKVEKAVVDAPHIRVDEVEPFENPITGEIETSMSTYERKLRDYRSEDAPNGYFIKGNERMKYELPSFDERYEQNLEASREAERQVKYGMAKSTPDERAKWDQEMRDKERASRN